MNFAAVLDQEEIYRLILAKGGNFDLQDTNGCTVTHIMVVYDNIKMFDMATECGAAINIENKQGLTPLTNDYGSISGKNGHVLPHCQH